MGEHVAHLPSGIDICYETFGDPGDPAMLLVMGLGCPMGWWSVPFCERLVAEGCYVIRYDNRDVGRSTTIEEARVSRQQVLAAFAGRRRHAPYSISDMAGDGFGLLDALEIEAAHVVGVSMGGMIAQTMAIEHPERVLTLTSIMSTTGRRTVGWQHPAMIRVLMSPAGTTRDEFIARSMRVAIALDSPGYELDRSLVIDRANETFDRGWSASGVVRQMLAVMTQPDRTAALRSLRMPVCVIHGLSDRLVHPSGGRATAHAISGAELITIPGMGHDMPGALLDTYIRAIARTASRASARAA